MGPRRSGLPAAEADRAVAGAGVGGGGVSLFIARRFRRSLAELSFRGLEPAATPPGAPKHAFGSDSVLAPVGGASKTEDVPRVPAGGEQKGDGPEEDSSAGRWVFLLVCMRSRLRARVWRPNFGGFRKRAGVASAPSTICDSSQLLGLPCPAPGVGGRSGAFERG